MALVRSFKNAAPRYPERVAIYMPRGTRLLAERIAAERGVSPTDLMRGALGKAVSGMVAIDPAAADQASPDAPEISGAVTMRIADGEARDLVQKALHIKICEPFAGAQKPTTRRWGISGSKSPTPTTTCICIAMEN